MDRAGRAIEVLRATLRDVAGNARGARPGRPAVRARALLLVDPPALHAVAAVPAGSSLAA
ncbi:hypothetical protein [Pseudonocardia sp. H11422]|uniref:hypothetical protein n=1 Tax=Pseudonocardia sp. H11422 TaxID=2835866 RepID=UPI001BDBFBE2|nr:hypothetical protein [Pseudonocardia sp. H11422]